MHQEQAQKNAEATHLSNNEGPEVDTLEKFQKKKRESFYDQQLRILYLGDSKGKKENKKNDFRMTHKKLARERPKEQ